MGVKVATLESESLPKVRCLQPERSICTINKYWELNDPEANFALCEVARTEPGLLHQLFLGLLR
jgi:hypothetical protein